MEFDFGISPLGGTALHACYSVGTMIRHQVVKPIRIWEAFSGLVERHANY